MMFIHFCKESQLMQGYSSCKQNHLKICYKCAHISYFLGVKIWNVKYAKVILQMFRKEPSPKMSPLLFPTLAYCLATLH